MTSLVLRSVALLLGLCTVVEGQQYEEDITHCGATTMYHCLSYEWKQAVPLAWDDGNQSLTSACKSFTATSAKTQKKITCISSPNNGNDNICLPKVTETTTEITLTNKFAIHEDEVPGFVGDLPFKTIACTYEKTQTLTTSIATYTAKNIELTGSGTFDVDLLPCGKLGDVNRLCSNADMYSAGQATVPRQGNLYFRSCLKGVDGVSLYPVIRKCTTYDAIPPGHTASTELAAEYCGVKEFIDSANDITYKTKIFHDTDGQCSMLQVAAHKYAASDNLYIACTITVCTEAKCNNLRATTLDDSADTCRLPWVVPPTDANQRRLSGVPIEGPDVGQGTFRSLVAESSEPQEGKDYKSVQVLSNAKSPTGAFIVGGSAESQSGTNVSKETKSGSRVMYSLSSLCFLLVTVGGGLVM